MKVNIPQKIKPLFIEHKRYNILEGGRGGGKSHAVAEHLLIEGLKEKKRILCTREVQKSIDDSVYKLLCDKIIEHGYNYVIQNNKIFSPVTGSEFFFSGLQGHTINSIKSFEAIDICWVEEAQTISKKSLDILVPTVRKEDSYFIFTMNRYEEMDPVYDFCMKHDNTLHIKINYPDNPFCPKELIDEAERCKDISKDDYLHIWLGEPINQAEMAIIKRGEVLASFSRPKDTEGQVEFGVDVARFGNDRTVITKRKGLAMLDCWQFTKQDTVETANFIMAQATQEDMIKVDDTGVGGGVTDILASNGYNVVPVNFGESANDKDKYPNAISEMWFEFAEMIGDITLIDMDGLLEELTTRQWKMDNKGRRKVESKDDFKKRYGRSPDIADSVLLCFYNSVGNLTITFI